MELYTVNKFHKLVLEIANGNDSDVYSIRMVQNKLTQKYGNSMTLITRQEKSNIIMLDRVSSILSEEWYQQKKASQQDVKCSESKFVPQLNINCSNFV